ncbi:sensor histidine kinase [Actinocatenispora thailandica]|uniref:sensor histidine kinase n=1 Tax=Actinocatenispora thailandica TaxID=227318 RepID=UPI00194F1D50|nr:histidine kinase [Actinocatenispora thailandica]
MQETPPSRHTRTGPLAVVLLAAAALGSVPLALDGAADPAALATVWLVTGLQLAATPAVLLLRTRPVAAAVLVAAVVVAGLLPTLVAPTAPLLRYTGVNLWPPLALSTVVIGLRLGAPQRRAVPVWVLIAAGTVLAARPWQPTWVDTPIGLLHTAVPALLGLYLAARVQMVRTLRERAELAERERVLLTERARAGERTRLAAELHDSVAHRVNLMVLQAGALRMTSPDQPVRDAAEALRVTGCQALEELSDLLGVLRRGPDRTERPDEAVLPAGPGLPVGPPGELAALVADSRAVGLPVELDQAGDPALASPVVRRTAYRVVQEGLTNVHKHAPGAPVTVTVRYRTDQVHLIVHNGQSPGPAAGGVDLAGTGTGSGIAGLRGRLDAIGGSLRAGPTGHGGFQLDARMPSHVSTSTG